MKKYGKRVLAALLVFVLALGMVGCTKEEKKDQKSQIEESAKSLSEAYGSEKDSVLLDASVLPAGDGGSDWTAIALAFSGTAKKEEEQAYLKRLEDYVAKTYKQSGTLSKVKATEYHRIALTMLALSGNPEKVKTSDGVINLVADGTWNFTGGSPGLQGANGLCYGLLLLDAGNYTNSRKPDLRKDMITELLTYQKKSGGFCIDNSLDPEVDITAMAIQALAPYRNEEMCKRANVDAGKLKKSIDAALSWLAGKETEKAEFLYDGTASSESISQVILALCAMGKDPKSDSTFTKKDTTLLDALSYFRTGNGMYLHEKTDEEESIMATYQALIAMEAVQKEQTEKRWIYDFTDRK